MSGDERREPDLQAATAAESRPSPAEPPPALADLFRDHHERVYRAAYRITGDPSDAEDVLQNVFLRLLRRGDELDLSATASPYLHRAAVNTALDLLRVRRRAPAVELGEVAERLADGEAVGPEGFRRGRELRQALRRGLAKLNPETAEVFVLRYIEGFANHEIASLLDLPPTTVAVRLHRARLRLQKELGGHRGDQP